MADGRPRSNVVYTAGLAIVTVALLVLLGGLAWRIMAPPDPVVVPLRTDDRDDLLGERIQVQVLNGAGVPGAARVFRLHLARYGFDVVESGDRRPFDVEETRVIDRIGNRDAALRVARALGLPEDAVDEEIRPSLYVHATVVIGRDYETRTTVPREPSP